MRGGNSVFRSVRTRIFGVGNEGLSAPLAEVATPEMSGRVGAALMAIEEFLDEDSVRDAGDVRAPRSAVSGFGLVTAVRRS